jgi:hypothetical protein
MMSRLLVHTRTAHTKLKRIIISPSNVNYRNKGKRNIIYMGFTFSAKESNRILRNLHFNNTVIIMSCTDGILLILRYLLRQAAGVLIGTVSVQKTFAR